MATTWRQQYFWDDETIRKEAREFGLTDEILQLIYNWGWWGWGGISWIKVNWSVVTPDSNNYVSLTIPQVINNLNSTSTTNALSAAQWKVLYEYIQALQHVWHFLSLWNTSTWLPVTNPQTSPYPYNTWDYYIVSAVASWGWTNYKPNGSSYTNNVASTTVETDDVSVNDLYFYDWTTWRLLDNSGWWGSSIVVDSSLSTTSTNPVENQAITNVLNTKANSSDLANYQPKVIEVTVTTWPQVQAKVWTTTDWNYVPAYWDILLVRFTQWCYVGWPTLNIDWSWAKSIYICNDGANAGNFYLWDHDTTWPFIYNWSKYMTWPVKDNNTVYSTITYAEGTAWTETGNRVVTPAVLKQIIEGIRPIDQALDANSGNAVANSVITNALANYVTQNDLESYLTSTDVVWGTGINVWPVGSDVPDWYTQLTCIQLNWTQALRTNITWVWSTVELDLQCSSTAANVQEICAWDEDYLGTFFWIYWDAFAVQNSTSWKISGVNVMNRNTISWAFSRNTNPSVSLTVGWNTVSYTRTSNRTDNYLCIWWATSTLSQVLNWFSWYIYSVKVYNTSTSELIANYIPCRDNNTSNVWLYDTVSWTFNTATVWSFAAWDVVPVDWIQVSVDDTVWTDDTVEAGDWITITQWVSVNLPSWYTPVEYLESDGTQYINTQIVPISTSWFDVDFIARSPIIQNTTFGCILWWRTSSGVDELQLTTFMNNTPNEAAVWWTIRFGTSTNTANPYIVKNMRMQVSLIENVVTTSNNSSTQTLTTPSYANAKNIYLFWLNNWGNFDQAGSWCRIYSVKLYEWTTVVAEMYPCIRDSDDEPGMYDVVRNTFYANSWTWDFDVWPVLSPKTIISADVTSADVNTKTFFLEDDEDTTTAAEMLGRWAEWTIWGEQRYPIIYMEGKTYLMSAGGGFRWTATTTLRFVNVEPERDVIGYSTTELSQDAIEISWTIDTETFAVSGVTITTETNILWDFLEAKSWWTYITPRTPTYDWDPTTKKYVDDTVSGAISAWTAAPSSPTEWQLWYDTTNDVLKVYNWTAWVAVSWWGVAITDVTVSTAYSTAAKVWTTTAWNYVPASWDLLLVNFVNGCGTTSAPTLAIDSGTAYGIRVGNTSATNTYFALWSTANSNVKVLMYFDWSYYKVWSTENKTYTSMSSSTAETWTSTTANTISASVLKSAIQAHAITLDPNSPLTVTTIWAGTETQYQALTTKWATTAYLCVEE